MVRRHLIRRYWHLLLNADMQSTRVILAWGAILWSIMLFWPGDTFDRPSYTIMGHIASETVWATAFGVQGVVMLWSLLYGYRNRITLMVDAVLGCLLWSTSCLCILASVYPPPAAISAEITSAVASWWFLVRYTCRKA